MLVCACVLRFCEDSQFRWGEDKKCLLSFQRSPGKLQYQLASAFTIEMEQDHNQRSPSKHYRATSAATIRDDSGMRGEGQKDKHNCNDIIIIKAANPSGALLVARHCAC